MNKAPMHDEAHALLAAADGLSGGKASKDPFVHFALNGGDWLDLIEALYEFAAEEGIILPQLDKAR